MKLRLKIGALKFINFVKKKFSLRTGAEEISEIKKSIEELKAQFELLSGVAYDQSLMIVSLAKVQAEVVDNLKTIDENCDSDNYLLLKIPIRDDDIVN